MHRALVATFVAAAVMGGTPVAAAAAPGHEAGCGPQWTVSTVAGGFVLPLENLGFDGRGGLLVSKTLWAGIGEAEIDSVSPDGSVRRLFKVNGPGAIDTRGNTVYFNTGHNTLSGQLGLTDGTIDTYNLDTGQRSTWATGLTMPDGMTLLPNGDAVTSTLIGPKTGLSLVRHQDPRHPVRYPLPEGVSVPLPNGLTVANDKRTLYAASTFGLGGGSIYPLDLTDPAHTLAPIPVTAPYIGSQIDDITTGQDGKIYAASEARNLGSVFQIDPASGTTCLIASGVTVASSVRFGAGPGWDPRSLYSTGFDGTIRRITPPTGG